MTDSAKGTPREDNDKIELPPNFGIKIPKLNVSPIVKERDEDSEAENQNKDDKDDLFDKHFNELDLQINREPQINTLMSKFLLRLYSIFPPFWPLEIFVKVILMIQILSLVLSPLDVNWGYYGRYVLQIHTWIFLGGSSGPTLFHFSFFSGTFLSCSYMILTYLCFNAKGGQSIFAFLGLLLNLTPMLFVPTMVGSLSIIFKLVTSQTNPEDAYVYTFGVIGCLQAVVIFVSHMFYTAAYFEWRSSTVKENIRNGRPNNRFELFFYFCVTIMIISYHFYIVLDYVTVSINMVVMLIIIIAGLHYLPYYNLLNNVAMIVLFVQVWLASIIAFWTTIFNRTALSEVPLYVYLCVVILSIIFGVFVTLLRILIISWSLRKRSLPLESSGDSLKERFFPPFRYLSDFEIATHTMFSDEDILYTNEVYKWLRRDYLASTMFHISWANYLAFKLRSPIKAIILLDLIRHNYKTLDAWLLYLMQRAWIRENINYFTNPESTQIGLARARHYEDEVKKLHLMFWYSVNTCGNLSHFFKKDQFIPDIVKEILRVEDRSTELYSKIVHDGSTATVHHNYAMYCQNVLGDLTTADLHETHARSLEMRGELIEEPQAVHTDYQPENDMVPQDIGGDSPRKGDKGNDTDSDVDNRYGLNYDEDGNRKNRGIRDVELPDVDIREEDSDETDDEKHDVFEKAAGNITLPEPVSLQNDLYGTPLENIGKLGEVEIEDEKKKTPIVPKLSLRKSMKNTEGDGKGSAKSGRLHETFRADILIPNDDELSLISGLSENDVIEDQNTIGANEKLTYKVMRAKISEKTTMTSFNCCIFTPGIISILLIIVCYILVFIDLGIFSVQMVPIIAAGSVNLYASRIQLDVRGAQIYSQQPRTNQTLAFDATMTRLRNSGSQFQSSRDSAFTILGYYDSHCTFQCELVRGAQRIWNDDSLSIISNFGPKISTLREYTDQISRSISTIGGWTAAEFSKGGINPDIAVVLQNDTNTVQLLKTIQSNYININYGKLGLIFLLTILSIFFVIISCIPFHWMLQRAAEIRKNALILYDIILSDHLAPKIFSSLKAKDMIRGEHYKQLSTEYFAEHSHTNAFKKRYESTEGLVWRNIVFIIGTILLMFAGLWVVYALNAYTYAFIVSDVRCSGERMIHTTNIHKMLLEIQNGTTNYTLADVRSELESLYYLHRAILFGNYSSGNNTGFTCAASEFRYTPQYKLLNSPRCGNNSVECMSLNQLVTYFVALGQQISNPSSPDVSTMMQIELEQLTPLFNASMNLYVTEGQFYSDIMFNCLAFVFAINLCLFGLYSYGCMTPTLARISEDILISERMFSLVPIRFLTTDSRIRKFLNLQIFEQQELEVEKAQKEAEFYRKILGNSNQPIILFERSMGQVLITKMNDVAMHLFECHDDMVGLPLITLFPNQAGVITRYIQSIQSDPKLFPQEIEIQGRGSSGKILFLLASFGQVNSEVSVCHLKVQPKNLHDIIQERERMIKSLQYETIPAEYRNRLQSGERSIYHYVSDLTMVACDLGDLDKLVLARSDEDKSVIYNAVFSVLEELADQFKLHQIPTPGNQFICLGEIGDHIEPGTQPENVVNFAEAAIKAIHVLNLQLPVKIQISIALHFGGGMVGIRGKYREGERTRFAIDVYGDVVRELALLVDMCSPCQVVVSPEFYQVAPIDRKFRETEGVYEMLVMESKLDGITESPLLKTFQRDFDEHVLEF